MITSSCVADRIYSRRFPQSLLPHLRGMNFSSTACPLLRYEPSAYLICVLLMVLLGYPLSNMQDLVLEHFSSRSVTDVVRSGRVFGSQTKVAHSLRAFGPLLPIDPSRV